MNKRMFATRLLLAGSLALAASDRFVSGQTPSPLAANAAVSDDFSVVQVGPHSCVWANSAGQSVTSIQTGMNYWDGQQWTPSNPSFQVSADGTSFVANQIQDQTRLAAN